MSVTSAINTELIEWFAELPVWQSEAFRRLLVKPVLDENDYSTIVACARAELGLDARTELPPRLTDLELPIAPPVNAQPLKLTALHSLTGVNLLTQGQRLNFGEGLTLIYGSNAAGKSGYARLLKRACRCHEAAVEPILPNIYNAQPAVAVASTACFDVSVGGVVQTLNWQDNAIVQPILRNFVIFDSKAARSYLKERNTVTAMPPILAKLEQLSIVIKTIKERLATEAATILPNPVILQPYIDASPTGILIGGLNATTPPQALVDALVWTEADESKLSDLTQQELKLKNEGPQALRRQIQQRRTRLSTLITRLQAAELLVNTTTVEAIHVQHKLCTQLKEQKEAAAKVAFDGSLVTGVGTAAWETLIRSAANFFATESETEDEFPGTPNVSRCVLCQQVLAPESHDRLKKFWQFMQNDLSRRLALAEEQLTLLLSPMKDWSAELPPDLIALSDTFQEELATIWPKVLLYYTGIAARRDAVLAAAINGDWDALPAEAQALSVDCVTEDTALKEKESALDDTAKAQVELAKLTAQVSELAARKKATAARDTLLDYHKRLIRAVQLRAASASVSTMAVSSKSTSLQKKHVTKAFSIIVQQHARDLGLRRAVPEITSQTEYGKATQSVLIDGAKIDGVSPAQVLSEGEQTALSLAYFFADYTDATTAPTLIFDDPVTSLDHCIRAKVVEKLVALAAGRQVVVFTHDLCFYCGLKDAATRANVQLNLRSIESVGPHVGRVREGEPIDAMSVTAREQYLGDILKQAQQQETAGDAVGLGDTTARFYSVLRATWERVVEELLFNKVVIRFDDTIKTQSLTGAIVDAEIIATVFAAMTKCSGFIDGHDHAAAANVTQPDITVMKADLETLRVFRIEQKKKSKTQEESLKHLKA